VPTVAAGELRVEGRVGVGLTEWELWLPRAGDEPAQVVVSDEAGLRPSTSPGGAPIPPLPVGLGVVALGVTGPEASIRMDGEQFTLYLAEEGLTDVSIARSEAGEVGAPVREVYRRYLKVITTSGDRGGAAVATTPLGLALEIVPAKDPLRARPGRDLTWTVWLNGAPLADRDVHLVWLEGVAERRVDGRTDVRGRVRLPVPDAEWWVVRLVHMARADRADADWQSWWGALTVAR
jgi:hypothetical protein